MPTPSLDSRSRRHSVDQPVAGPSVTDTSAHRASETPIALVVDDYAPMLSLLSSVLTRAGYEVRVADNGIRGLAVMLHAEGRVDLLLVDVRMPGIDGLRMADKVRLAWPRVPIVLMSGFAPEETRNTEQPGGPILAKPFTQEQLQAAIVAAREKVGLPSKPFPE